MEALYPNLKYEGVSGSLLSDGGATREASWDRPRGHQAKPDQSGGVGWRGAGGGSPEISSSTEFGQEVFFFSSLLGKLQLKLSARTASAKQRPGCVFMFGFFSLTHCGMEVVGPIKYTPWREEMQVI